MGIKEQELNDMKEYLLSNLDLTIDSISHIYHYDYSLEEFHVYRNTEDVIDGIFCKPHELAQAISKGEYTTDHPYFYFKDNTLYSVTEQEYIKKLKENITDIVLTLMTHEVTCLYFTREATLLQKYSRP